MTSQLARVVLAAAIAAAAGATAGCEADESAPRRPRTGNFLSPDEKARDNAERRELEPPKRSGPGTTELPGQSSIEMEKIPGMPTIVTAADFGTRSTRYGTLPHVHTTSRDIPAVGFTTVPGVSYPVDHSWGQVIAMSNYPHRAWPTSSAAYQPSGVQHNPTYYTHITDKWAPLGSGSTVANIAGTVVEVPWFLIQTAAAPVKMVQQHPFTQVTTRAPLVDPVHNGFVPTAGAIIPAPYEGEIRWDYDWQKAHRATTTTAPGTTQP